MFRVLGPVENDHQKQHRFSPAAVHTGTQATKGSKMGTPNREPQYGRFL